MRTFSLLIVTALLLLAGCTKNNQEQANTNQPADTIHNSQNALDWAGSYSGTMPCASCPGIETTLELNEDGTYQLTTHYLDEGEPNTVKNIGTFSWDNNGQVITLNNKEAPNQYFVGENYLAKLDMEGKRITGELAEQYILRKE